MPRNINGTLHQNRPIHRHGQRTASRRIDRHRLSTGGSPEVMASTIGIVAAVLALAAVISLLIGLIALHARQADRLPGPGLTGFILATVGAAMTAAGVWSAVFVVPVWPKWRPTCWRPGSPRSWEGSSFPTPCWESGDFCTGSPSSGRVVVPRSMTILLVVGGVICLAPYPPVISSSPLPSASSPAGSHPPPPPPSPNRDLVATAHD